MSLAPGARLGPYEIVGALGAGGMGEVYRARDTRLQRDVALKIIPAAFAADPERLARFEREAQVLASLNHPHIAAIYGIEHGPPEGGPHSDVGAGFSRPMQALVLELVEGETLADRIARGAIPLDEAVPIARQIADALEAAHHAGIIHRDLKPANVKVRADGTVKVLDFGLAKAVDPAGSSSANRSYHLSMSPTLTSPMMTGVGAVLGTAAYMSPEQARGREVDKRADIWAFGCLVFEMLTGRAIFAGETVSDTVAAVLRQEIDWSALPASTPPAIRRLLRRCLDKDPRRRLRDIGDAALELDEPPTNAEAVVVQPTVRAGRAASLLPWLVAAAATAGAIAIWASSRDAAAEPSWQGFTPVTDAAGIETSPTLSPDGATVAYASRARGSWDIYAVRVGGRNPVVIAGDPDRDEADPAFSPDGASIAFHESDADGGIFVAGATGESPRRLTDAGFHPAWSADGRRIAFSTEEINDPASRGSDSTLWIVEAAGGPPQRVAVTGDAAQPAWSPSGERLAYWSNTGGQRDLFTVAVAGGPRVAVVEDAPLDWAPTWTADGRYLYFASNRGGAMNLWRIAVDQSSGRADGAPEPVTNGVQAAAEMPSISLDGRRLVFRSQTQAVNPVAIPFDPVTRRAGTPVVLDNSNSLMVPTGVSPDGRSLVFSNHSSQQEDLFVARTDLSGMRRLTDDVPRDRGAVWTPDGRAVVFYSNRGAGWEVWRINADGSGLQKAFGVPGTSTLFYPIVSPAGDRIVASSDTDVYIAPVGGDRTADDQVRKLTGTRGDGEVFVATDWSPDGRQLAGGLSLPNGSPAGVAVYDLGSSALRVVARDRVLTTIRWLPDSRHVVYFDRDGGELVVLDTSSGRREVVDVRLPLRPDMSFFAVARDGRSIYFGGNRTEADIWIVERR